MRTSLLIWYYCILHIVIAFLNMFYHFKVRLFFLISFFYGNCSVRYSMHIGRPIAASRPEKVRRKTDRFFSAAISASSKDHAHHLVSEQWALVCVSKLVDLLKNITTYANCKNFFQIYRFFRRWERLFIREFSVTCFIKILPTLILLHWIAKKKYTVTWFVTR